MLLRWGMASRISGITPLRYSIRDSIRCELLNAAVLRVRRHANVYTGGDLDESIFLVERGRIKLAMSSAAGKECLLGYVAAGDLFGELSLAHRGERLETATAVQDSIVRQIPASTLLDSLNRKGQMGEFVRYLAERLAERQQAIVRLLTADTEHRLAATLLKLGRKFGRPDPQGLCIDFRISHQELSQMVGTTRPRVTEFMIKFESLGLVRRTAKRSLIVNESRLAGYLDGSVPPFRSTGFGSASAKISSRNGPILD
jgi:CRP/FNR family transcriptional regulator, cyclic AMP receptor protein